MVKDMVANKKANGETRNGTSSDACGNLINSSSHINHDTNTNSQDNAHQTYQHDQDVKAYTAQDKAQYTVQDKSHDASNDKMPDKHEDASVNDLMDKNINAIVDKFLQNKLVNNRYIPDFIEHRIYTNVIKLIIGLLKETAETSSLNVLGHMVSFKIEPMSASSSSSSSEHL